jgi:hypothetical protein
LIRCCCWSWSSYLELENKQDLPTWTTETIFQECQHSSWRFEPDKCHTCYHLGQWVGYLMSGLLMDGEVSLQLPQVGSFTTWQSCISSHDIRYSDTQNQQWK